MFVQTHLHTIYSQMDAVSTPEEMIDKAVELNHKAICISDHGVYGAIPRFQKYALAKGIKPILGVEGYFCDTLKRVDEKEKRIRDKNNHLVLHAMNKEGWKNLMRLNYLSNSDEEHFYYKPRNSFKELFEYSKGICLGTACLASPFSNLLKRGMDDEAEKLFQEFLLHFGDNMYGEIQLNEIEDQKTYNEWIIYQSTKNGIPIIVAGDCHYADKDGSSVQAMAFRVSRDDDTEREYACKSLWYHSEQDYLDFNKKFGFNYDEDKLASWINNSEFVNEKCDFIYKPSTTSSLPRMAFDEEDELKKLGKKGLEEHFGKPLEECPKEYVDRLKMETDIIIKKGMMRYFLCLKDILDWCDEQKIPRGIGRGSCCGSLLAGCLGLTKLCVDPIKLNLYFDRFISEDRLPDAIYRYNIEDAEFVKTDNKEKYSELKSLCAAKFKDYPQYNDRLVKELYRAKIAYDNGIDLIETIKSFKENLSDAYVIPFFMGITETVDLNKPLEIQSLGIGSSGLDIDSDVSGNGKDLIFKHLQEKYGVESVCYIGTYTEEGIKPGIKDVLRKEMVPYKDSLAFTAALPDDETDWDKMIAYLKTSSPQSYQLYLRYKEKLDYVPKIQHFIRSTGCHAGGNIIFNKPVYEYVPVIRNKGEIATAWVENGAETVLDEFAGVIKYDILGLNTLDIVDDCVDSIDEELVMIEDDDGIVKIVGYSYIKDKMDC